MKSSVPHAKSTDVPSSGTVSPGASPGILSTQGNVILASLNSFLAELNGLTAGSTGKNHDQLSVAGTVNLGGSQLITSVGFSSVQGNAFTIINNDGTDAIVGTFAGLAEDKSGITPQTSGKRDTSRRTPPFSTTGSGTRQAFRWVCDGCECFESLDGFRYHSDTAARHNEHQTIAFDLAKTISKRIDRDDSNLLCTSSAT